MRLWLLFTTVCSAAYSLSLMEVEELALTNNPQVRAAEELVERAKQGRSEAFSKWLPKLSVLSQAFRTQKPLTFLGLHQPSAFFTQISLTQAIIASDLYRDLKIASLLVQQFDRMLDAAKNDILLQARILYYAIALDHKLVATAKEHINLLYNLTERMQGKYNIGEAISYNVNQARVAMANVTDAYYEAQKRLRAHQDELTQVLGFDPIEAPFVFDQEEIDVMQVPDLATKIEASEALFQENNILKEAFILHEKELMDRIFSKEELDRWTTAADESRPDIQLSKTYMKIARQSVKKQYGEYVPSLSILGGYGGGSTPYLDQPSTRLNNEAFKWAFGLSLNWMIFDGAGRESRIKRAKAEERSVRFDAKKTIQAAHTDVRTQIYTMEKALAKFLTSSANLKLAEQTLQQAFSQLDIGYTTIYDYLVSVDGLIRARTSFDEGKFELLASHYALLHACGKGAPHEK